MDKVFNFFKEYFADFIGGYFKDFSFDTVKDIFNGIVDYFKNFKTSNLYRFGDMIVAIVTLFIVIFK
jgi:hypothetical protein